jgi:hypothetical protein
MKGFADLLFLRWSGMPVNSLQKTRFYVGGIPQRLEPRIILHDLRRGLKPRPFKAIRVARVRQTDLRLGKDCDGGGFGLHALAHQAFHLRPQAGIALALRVGGREEALKPRRSWALHGRFLIIETVVAENLRLRIIGGGDASAAVEQAVGLIEVGSRSDIFRDDPIALPGLGDAVNLYGEQHGDSGTVQFTSQHDDGGRSPTVAEENDARLRFFDGAQHAIMIGIEPAKNSVVGRLAVAILEDLDRGTRGKVWLKSVGELHRAVVEIVVTHEAAGKTNEDVRACRRSVGDGAVGGGECGRCYGEEHERGEK